MFSYPLVAQTDMPQKMKLGKNNEAKIYINNDFNDEECQELCSSIMEKHSDNEVVR